MKLLFLDIDGVLLPFGSGLSGQQAIEGFGVVNLQALSFILEQSAATVVLSSTWRCSSYGLQQIERVFKAFGERFGGPLKDFSGFDLVTDEADHGIRSGEILRFIDSFEKKHGKIENWLALDDDDSFEKDEDSKEKVKHHYILCESSIGLTLDQAKQAVQMLRN